MEDLKEKGLINKFTYYVSKCLLTIGIIVLGAMMFLTAIDVILRYIFNRPVPGSYELTQFMMAIVVPFGIAYCAYAEGHVNVDLIITRFSKRVQNILGIITSLFSLGLFILITWQNLKYVKEQFESKLTSAVLLIPVYPFVFLVALGIAVFCLVLFRDIMKYMDKGAER
jgi:TRAP-type C4-dicarboxylate transport system permease small subunit